jgi:hypothetical protein
MAQRRSVLCVQPPFFRLLGFPNNRLGVAISHDCALARSAGHEAHILNLEAGTEAPRQECSWQALAEASHALPHLSRLPEFDRALDELTQTVEAQKPDVVVVSCGDWAVPAKDVSDAALNLALGRRLRSLGIWRVAVGFQCTTAPAAFLGAYDSVVTGLPGRALLSAVNGEAGRIAGSGLGEYVTLLPALDVVGPAPDTRCAISEFGCPFGRCNFCPSALQFRGLCQAKEPSLFVADVARRPERSISIVDNYFGFDVARLRRLSALLAHLGKTYTVDVRTEAAENPEVLQFLRDMGTVTVKVGVESLSDAVLRKMQKGQTVRRVIERLRRFHDAGFHVFAYLLLGTPGDTPETMAETLARAEELDFVQFLPNVYCQAGDSGHHFSLLQADRIGIPRSLMERALQLSERGRREAKTARLPARSFAQVPAPIGASLGREERESLRESRVA